MVVELSGVDRVRIFLRTDSWFVGLPGFPPGSLAVLHPYAAPPWKDWRAIRAIVCEDVRSIVVCSDFKAPE